MKRAILRMILYKIIMYFNICFFSIVVICIDNCKWLMQNFFTGKNSMSCSPWFYSAFRQGESFRNILKLLKNISDFHKSFSSLADGFTENLFVLTFNNKDNLFKACTDSVIN